MTEVFCVFIFLVLLCSSLGILATHLWFKSKALEDAAYDLIEMDKLQSQIYARKNPHIFKRPEQNTGHSTLTIKL